MLIDGILWMNEKYVHFEDVPFRHILKCTAQNKSLRFIGTGRGMIEM